MFADCPIGLNPARLCCAVAGSMGKGSGTREGIGEVGIAENVEEGPRMSYECLGTPEGGGITSELGDIAKCCFDFGFLDFFSSRGGAAPGIDAVGSRCIARGR